VTEDLRSRLRGVAARYPTQFWLLFWGALLSASAGSMVWPFLTIYVRQQLAVPMTTAALLLTVNAGAGLLGLSLAGPAADRFGRKPVMLASLTAQGVAMIGMSLAATLPAWIGVMALFGAFNPLFRVGADAMVADLLEPEARPGGYALLRMIANLGVAIGPLIGGFVVAVSYDIAFYASAAASLAFALWILLRARETLPPHAPGRPGSAGNYAPVLRDRPFLAFIAVYAVSGMAYIILMVLLPSTPRRTSGYPSVSMARSWRPTPPWSSCSSSR
jgi:MFS family permease